MAKQLERCPGLGSFIRVIFLSSFPDRVPDDTLHVILSHSTHVEFFPFQGLHTFSPFSPQNFELLARTTGSSLREFAGSPPSSTEMPMAILRHFPELRVLDLMECSPVFTSNQSVPVNGLNKLHILQVHKGGFKQSLFQGLLTMRLESLHTLLLTFADFYGPPFVTFMRVYGGLLFHLTIGKFRGFNLFDVCNNLVDIQFHGMCRVDSFSRETPHASLTKITASSLPKRDISKSSVVPLAEYLLEKNIKSLDAAGKHWTPRLKNSKAQKR
ncbi:hypothetical protein C8R45DRAFT_1145730 [Mycena sanguinolenta]|nr:hypothetical protein C8R45DRAFT_1145730 [Mycena sanguinolenta]